MMKLSFGIRRRLVGQLANLAQYEIEMGESMMGD